MPDYSNVPRDSRRIPIATKVQLQFDLFSGFISEYSANLSPTGMFIVSRSPEPPGRVLDFEFHLGDGFEIIKGKGEVVWVRAVADGPHRPPGMGIRFLELSPGSKELIYRIVDQYVAEGGTPFDLSLASAAAPAAAAGAQAPAPAPTPASASESDLLAPLPPLDLEPDPFPNLEPEPLPESSSNVLPWRRPAASPARDESGSLQPADEIFALEEPRPLSAATASGASAAAGPPRLSYEAALSPLTGSFRDPFPEAAPPPPASPYAPMAPMAPMAPLAPATPAPLPDDLFAAYLPQPATPPEPTMSRSLSSVAGSASARPERQVSPGLLLAALLVVALAAGGYLFRGEILGLLGFGGGGEEIAEAPPSGDAPPLRQPQPAAPPPPAVEAAPGLTSGIEVVETEPTPSAQVPAPQEEPGAIEEGPLPEPVQRKPAARETVPVDGPVVTAIERITWEPASGGTDVVLWGNGSFRPESFRQTSMVGPPRALIRVLGIRRPFSPHRIPVGTPQVRQVRTGYHRLSGGSELHVVIDLAGAGVEVSRIDQDGQRLRIHLEGR